MKRFLACVLTLLLMGGLLLGFSARSDALVLSGNLHFNLEDFFRSETMGHYWSVFSKSLLYDREILLQPSQSGKVLSDYYRGPSGLAVTQGNPTTTVQLNSSHDVVFTFECPAAGVVQVVYSVRRSPNVPVKDGFSSFLSLNGEIAWPESKTPIVNNTNNSTYEWTNFEVKKGDRISLVLGGLTDRTDDKLLLDQFRLRYLSGDNFYHSRPTHRVAVLGDIFSSSSTGDYVPFLEAKMNESTTRLYDILNISPSWGTVLSGQTSLRNNNAAYLMMIRKELNFIPDTVLICLGVNDAAVADFNSEKYSEEYGKLVEDLRKLNENVQIYVVSSPYLTTSKFDIPVDLALLAEQVIPLQRQLAKDLGCEWIDLASFMKKLATENNKVYPKDNIRGEIAEYLFNALCWSELPGLNSNMATYSEEVLSSGTIPPANVVFRQPVTAPPTVLFPNKQPTQTTPSEPPSTVVTPSEDSENLLLGGVSPSLQETSETAPADSATQSDAPSAVDQTDAELVITSADVYSETITEAQSETATSANTETIIPVKTEKEGSSVVLWCVFGGAVLVAAGVTVFLLKKKK